MFVKFQHMFIEFDPTNLAMLTNDARGLKGRVEEGHKDNASLELRLCEATTITLTITLTLNLTLTLGAERQCLAGG